MYDQIPLAANVKIFREPGTRAIKLQNSCQSENIPAWSIRIQDGLICILCFELKKFSSFMVPGPGIQKESLST